MIESFFGSFFQNKTRRFSFYARAQKKKSAARWRLWNRCTTWPPGISPNSAARRVVGGTLELQRADDPSRSTRRYPALHQAQHPRRIGRSHRLNSQSTGIGARANALSCNILTRPAKRGSSGALSTAVTSAPSSARTKLHPPGDAPRSMQVSPGPGQTPSRVSASPQFQIGAARRPDVILLEPAFAVDERAGLRGTRQQSSAASTGSRRRDAPPARPVRKHQRPGTHRRQTRRDERRAAMVVDRIIGTSFRCRARNASAASRIEATGISAGSVQVSSAHATGTAGWSDSASPAMPMRRISTPARKSSSAPAPLPARRRQR